MPSCLHHHHLQVLPTLLVSAAGSSSAAAGLLTPPSPLLPPYCQPLLRTAPAIATPPMFWFTIPLQQPVYFSSATTGFLAKTAFWQLHKRGGMVGWFGSVWLSFGFGIGGIGIAYMAWWGIWDNAQRYAYA